MTRTTRWVRWAAAFGLVIAGCGGDDSSATPGAVNADGSSDGNAKMEAGGAAGRDSSAGGGGTGGSGGTAGSGGSAASDSGSNPGDASAIPDGTMSTDGPSSDADLGPLTIFAAASKPTGIALDATDVYWADEEAGAIYRCPKTGCGASAPDLVVTTPAPRGIALVGTTLFWVSHGDADASTAPAVKKCTLGACAAAEATDLGPAQAGGPLGNVGIAADSQTFYVVGGPTVVTCPIAGCGDAGTGHLGNFNGPIFGVAVDATTAYIGGLFRGLSECPLSGCSSPEDETKLVSQPQIAAVAVDETRLYWSEYALFAAPLGLDGAIRACPKGACDEASADVLAAGSIGPYAMAVDDVSLYFTDNANGRVERISKNDSAHACVVDHFAPCEACAGQILCDGTCSASCNEAGTD